MGVEIVKNRIKTIYTKRGLTLEKLAVLIGMSRQGFYTSLRNDSLSIEKLFKVAQVLRVDPCDLVSDGDGYLIPDHHQTANDGHELYNTKLKGCEDQKKLMAQIIENQKERIKLLEEQKAKGV
jgi:transcriptional regulator with XRE-family HTH domain